MDASDPATPALALDVENECLWRDGKRIALTAKCFGLLRCLVERRPGLVTKRQLLQTVWPATRVEEGQVKQFVAELRRILEDDPRAPRFIESVRGRGYRFIADIALLPTAAMTSAPPLSNQRGDRHVAVELYGRQPQMDRLYRCLQRALAGRANLAFIEGDVGAGKTALVSTFVLRAEGENDLNVLKAERVIGARPASSFEPIIAAIKGWLVRQADDRRRAELLRHAPAWAALIDAGGQHEGQMQAPHILQGNGRREMFAQLCAWLECLSGRKPVVLWIDDLDHADADTIDLLYRLASQPLLGKVLILTASVPLEQLPEGATRQAIAGLLTGCADVSEIRLVALDACDIDNWIAARWAPVEAWWGSVIHALSSGIPNVVARILDVADPAELRAAWNRGGCAERTQTMYADNIELPASLQRWGARLLAQLSSQERDLLQTLRADASLVDRASLVINMATLDEDQIASLRKLARVGRVIRVMEDPSHGTLTCAFTCRFWWLLIQALPGVNPDSGTAPSR